MCMYVSLIILLSCDTNHSERAVGVVIMSSIIVILTIIISIITITITHVYTKRRAKQQSSKAQDVVCICRFHAVMHVYMLIELQVQKTYASFYVCSLVFPTGIPRDGI